MLGRGNSAKALRPEGLGLTQEVLKTSEQIGEWNEKLAGQAWDLWEVDRVGGVGRRVISEQTLAESSGIRRTASEWEASARSQRSMLELLMGSGIKTVEGLAQVWVR